MECIFCKIINGQVPGEIYEDESSLAFLDIRPDTPGHTLVIPKDHFENIYTIPDEALARTMLTVKKVALAVKNGLHADGINIVMNNEAPAGQVIFHAHIHIIPRYQESKDHLKGNAYKEGEVEEIIKSIKQHLD